MTAIDKLKEVSVFLKSKGIEDAHKESEIILTHALKTDRTVLYRDNPVVTGKNIKDIGEILRRRANREPLQYIIGHVEFCGLKIKVGPGVLIPRPETELIVEEVIKQFTVHGSRFTVLDLCTGSGCLALALARHIPSSDVYAVDISEKALEYARENARFNGIANVKFLKGNLFEAVKGMRFDIIVSNPPYVKRSDINNLQPEIREWEPLDALDGGEDGLRFYRNIFPLCRKYLKSNGYIVLETGDGESTDVVKIAGHSGLRCLSVVRDYSGIERILSLTLR
jgi:release factor glutamine methyltransferase